MAEPTPFARALADAIISGVAAMQRDMREMAEGRYTGRHSQAWLDGRHQAGSATPEPLWTGPMEALHFWSERRMEQTGMAGEPVVVYPAVAGSATPACTCEDEETGRGFEGCPVHDPDPRQ